MMLTSFFVSASPVMDGLAKINNVEPVVQRRGTMKTQASQQEKSGGKGGGIEPYRPKSSMNNRGPA